MVGQRVCINGKDGEISAIMPGNGTFRWFFVTFDDGTEDRFPEWEFK